ncbi:MULTISPECIES: chemotaxis protein [Marinobacter]|uniref:Two-component system, chemotaxis family, response regulator CheV n=1 Tax=Marinobacter segnicrescens TaxID=430453 RepID=A0A1I0A2L9_9GAMM|nr:MULTISPECIES: chemotaxis protein [Marinobacter]UZD66170.1 chemotaxis protein [Marinobacter sp. AN1]SES87887.1 two-component system, chemotaxis family, response regulator CheV [Marinobacter segnicrescens]
MTEASAVPQKLLLFRLAGNRLSALGTLKIREIMPIQRLTQIPHSHPAVMGTMNFRGSAVPVIDMAAAVGYPALDAEARKTASIIVTDIQRQEIGFLVRSVDRIVEANWKQVQAPPRALGDQAFITGLLQIDNDLVQLMDVELLLARVYPESMRANPTQLTDLERETLREQRILVVDDSQVARRQLADALDRENIPYEVTGNGQTALDRITEGNRDQNPVTILVSDIEMPGMDGYELTFHLRDDRSMHQPYIILHTSLNSEMSVSYAQQVGANEALTKFDAEELLHAMLRGASHSAVVSE